MTGKDSENKPIRPQQIAATLRRTIQEILARGLADPRFQGMVTVTHVDCSPDLKQATVYVSVMPESRQSLALHALKHASGFIRRQAGERMALKSLPSLTFRVDSEMKKQTEVFEALAKVAREREAKTQGAEHGGADAVEPGTDDAGDSGAGEGGAK